jgi:hypothetical protein
MKSIHKNETLWVTINTLDKKYFITSKENDRSMYYLYEKLDNGEVIKLAKHANPILLERKYIRRKNNG